MIFKKSPSYIIDAKNVKGLRLKKKNPDFFSGFFCFSI